MLDKAEYSAFESTLNSLSYRIVLLLLWKLVILDLNTLLIVSITWFYHIQKCNVYLSDN